MLRLGPTTIYTFIILLLTGCSGNDKKEPPVADIKLADLAPINPVRPTRPAQTVVLEFYGLQLPAENIAVLSDIWPMLYTKPVRLADPDAFAANSFQLAFGESQMWLQTATLLESGSGRCTDKLRLILNPGQTDDFVITELNQSTNISYLASNLSIESITAPAGQLLLKFQVLPVAGARGVCDLNAKPAFVPGRFRTGDKNPTVTEDVNFDALAFSVQISPGDFLLMGPLRYPNTADSLGGLFFTAAQVRTIRLYAIFCTGITD